MATAYHPSNPDQREESLGQLLKDLRDETTLLIRQEVALAKTEVSEKVSTASRNLGFLVTGGLVAYAGAVVLILSLAALVYWGLIAAELEPVLAAFLALLIVGGIVTAIGGALIAKAIGTLKDMTVVPERTVDSLKNDKDWIKDKVTS